MGAVPVTNAQVQAMKEHRELTAKRLSAIRAQFVAIDRWITDADLHLTNNDRVDASDSLMMAAGAIEAARGLLSQWIKDDPMWALVQRGTLLVAAQANKPGVSKLLDRNAKRTASRKRGK